MVSVRQGDIPALVAGLAFMIGGGLIIVATAIDSDPTRVTGFIALTAGFAILAIDRYRRQKIPPDAKTHTGSCTRRDRRYRVQDFALGAERSQ